MQATAEWLDTDYYDVLGVSPDASAKQIKSAYRKLARTAHPDANPDDSTAEQRFSDIAKAYEVLSDDTSRTEYDDIRARAAQNSRAGDAFSRHNAPGPGFGYQSASNQDFDMSDLFDLFGSGGSGRHAERNARPDWPMRGADLTARLDLSFTDAVNGYTTTLELDGRSIKTRIPTGVADGQTIRLAGKGQPGIHGGPSGDLFIEIAVANHPTFGRSGRNLTVTVPISYADAVLGGEMQVPTLAGSPVTIKVPSGTPVGKTFRVSGKGVPYARNPGHLLATVTIDVPTEVTDGERALLEQLQALA